MWELIVPNAAEICRKHCKDQNTSESKTDAKTDRNESQATPEVAASTFPDSCPFNYAVLALACMSQNPEDRPPMFQIQEVLRSVDVEVGSGRHYMDWTGSHRVRYSRFGHSTFGHTFGETIRFTCCAIVHLR